VLDLSRCPLSAADANHVAQSSGLGFVPFRLRSADIPTAPIQRHVEVLNEERDKVAKVPVRTDTNGKAN
jgi:hypothetical protein